jgi:inosine triphosphate pyrophosphatase
MLTFVTGNKDKLRETSQILGDSVDLKSQKVDLPELQGSVEEIAIKKAEAAAKIVGGPVITEDTCLCFNALKGLPGPYIKHFLEALGPEGLVKLLDGWPNDKSGYALCTFAYCAGPGQPVSLFQGRTDGTIVPPQGPLTFGWDPIFMPNGFTETFSQMSKEQKHSISHRGRSLAKLKAFFVKNSIN